MTRNDLTKLVTDWLDAGNTITVLRAQRRYKYGHHSIYQPGYKTVKGSVPNV